MTCKHTNDHRDPKGTWTQQTESKVTRIVCKVCGKFYGRIVPETKK